MCALRRNNSLASIVITFKYFFRLQFTVFTMTKIKKEKISPEEETGVTENSYEDLIANINPIANPLASRKLSKKLYKCVKKGESSHELNYYKLLL